MEEGGLSPVGMEIEAVFRKIGGFGWKEAETWAGFCDAVGMDPMPFLRVMIESVCPVSCCRGAGGVPSRSSSPELWVALNGGKTELKLVEPK